MSVIDKLSSGAFTASEESVVSFLLDNPDKVSGLNVRDLADLTYTSKTTVLRICRKLGFEGWKDFKMAFVIACESEKITRGSVDFSRPFYLGESTHTIISNMAALESESIRITRSAMTSEVMDNLVRTLTPKGRLFLFGVGDSRLILESFANKLIKLNIYPVIATANYEESAHTFNMTPDDSALFLTYEGMYERFHLLGRHMAARKIPYALITGNSECELMKNASAAFVIPHKEDGQKIATFYSSVAMSFVLDSVYALIYEQGYARYHSHKDNLDAFKNKT